SGKSTLAYAVMGHPSYKISNFKFQISNENTTQDNNNSITLDGKNLTELGADERARLGLFLAFQTPVSIPGVSVGKFLRHLLRSKDPKNRRSLAKPDLAPRDKDPNKIQKLQDILQINKKIDELAKKLSINPELLKRSLNDNFSGGEKKKIETLQMLLLRPKYALIDEIDTGLDVDALRAVATAIKELKKQKTGVLIITHYQRILKYVKPDFVHVMIGGKIVKSGDANLAKEIEKNGYMKFS
ncbi:Fe-S cluster assembly ATPase SufC, partial [Candidatus Roizmanbacteria bacterium]|nr:Fe-S cluster assembly ATPase SufC [Candidatus Roizmanbacteria bacterium]